MMDKLIIPRGFTYFPDFITLAEEQELLEQILKLTWQEVKMHGVVAKRRVIHFGLSYAYSNRNVTQTTPPPEFLHSIIKKAALKLNILPSEVKEILISEYPIGAGIGWHKDAFIFGDKVFGISLGSSCILKLRIKQNNKYIIHKIELAPRSAYILSDEVRNDWEHSIPPVKTVRYSITFRTLR